MSEGYNHVLIEIENSADGRRRFAVERLRPIGSINGRDTYEVVPDGVVHAFRDCDTMARVRSLELEAIGLFDSIKSEEMAILNGRLRFGLEVEHCAREQTKVRLHRLDTYSRSLREIVDMWATKEEIAVELKRVADGLHSLLSSLPISVPPPPKQKISYDHMSPTIARELREMQAAGLIP